MLEVFAIAVILAVAALAFWWRERRSLARTRTLRTILDEADALERELQDCRARLREIPALVHGLPPGTALSAHATLTAEPQVQQALHDLLQHRLWLRDHASDAGLPALEAASKALSESRRRLAVQLARLAEVREELASARATSSSGAS